MEKRHADQTIAAGSIECEISDLTREESIFLGENGSYPIQDKHKTTRKSRLLKLTQHGQTRLSPLALVASLLSRHFQSTEKSTSREIEEEVESTFLSHLEYSRSRRISIAYPIQK